MGLFLLQNDDAIFEQRKFLKANGKITKQSTSPACLFIYLFIYLGFNRQSVISDKSCFLSQYFWVDISS